MTLLPIFRSRHCKQAIVDRARAFLSAAASAAGPVGASVASADAAADGAAAAAALSASAAAAAAPALSSEVVDEVVSVGVGRFTAYADGARLRLHKPTLRGPAEFAPISSAHVNPPAPFPSPAQAACGASSQTEPSPRSTPKAPSSAPSCRTARPRAPAPASPYPRSPLPPLRSPAADHGPPPQNPNPAGTSRSVRCSPPAAAGADLQQHARALLEFKARVLACPFFADPRKVGRRAGRV